MTTFLIIIVTLPLLSAIVTAALGPKLLRGNSHLPTVVALLGSFVCAMLLLLEVRFEQNRLQAEQGEDAVVAFETTTTLWNWATIDDALSGDKTLHQEAAEATSPSLPFAIDITLRADALTSIMLVMVTFVALLVAIYASGYMHGDRGYWRFFTYVSLFVFSMTMLVSVSNFLLLYVFWEAVGVCSYLLIGFWYEKPSAAAAGKKAFLVNRVGDFGFALGIFLIWTTYGTLNFHDVDPAGAEATAQATAEADESTEPTEVESAAAAAVPGILGKTRLGDPEKHYQHGWIAFAICVLLLVGACGKSAQFPLHVWLPDAMEGPTPVSALIHAATMVTAGVYMVARCAPLFMMSPAAQLVVAVIGGITALMAGIIALTQFDLKRVLAYSTVSQLGYMFLALGCGTYAGISAGMFHLLTHAFFKALLFLGAGSVMHAMGGVIDMRRFGGLRKVMPITCWTFFIGCVALAGIPPLAGFFSKDSILIAVQERSQVHAGDHHHGESDAHHGDAAHAGEHAHHDNTHEASAPATGVEAWAPTIYGWLYWSALVTAFLTAFYTFRAFWLTFFGQQEIPSEAAGHAHESPPSMWVPLAILSVFAMVGGALGLLYAADTGSFLVHTPSLATDIVVKGGHHGDHTAVAMTSAVIAFLGAGLAAVFYLENTREVDALAYFLRCEWLPQVAAGQWVRWLQNLSLVAGIDRAASAIGLGWLVRLLGWILLVPIGLLLSPILLGYYLTPYNLSRNKFYLDEIYDLLIVRPAKGLACVSYCVDRWLIDGVVNFLGWLPRSTGSMLRSLQMGLVPFYALAMVLGVLIMLATWLIL